jgi:myo-inositol 2-dehydrogenase/D-chiro-inositol 1-dehydrogenase
MIRIAVLGAGRIGQIHAANVAANPNATLVSVSDTVPAAAAALAEKLGCEASTDALRELRRADVDAIIVGTPTDTHVPLTLAAVESGKPVLCEKPLDLDLAKADAAIAEIERHGVPVMIAFNRRFDPSASELRRAVLAGEIGDVRQVIITSRDPGPPPPAYILGSGGIFRDMLIHDFDMARWLLGEEPTEVFATASCLVDPKIAELGDADTTMVIMRTASGQQCHINTCREAVYGHDQRIEVVGSGGMLQNDHLRPHTVRHFTNHKTDARAPLVHFFLDRYRDAYRIELEHFIAALNGKQPMPVTPRDGRKALQLAECAIESVRSGRAVAVPQRAG